MSRRRSLPWIYRWSRLLIGAIAIVGSILTAYLTIVKLTGSGVACTASAAQNAATCNDVLNSPYGEVFGLPLSLFGFLAYLGMASFALIPLVAIREADRNRRTQLDDWTWLLLLAGATAMTVFSGYLMYVLAFKLQTFCPYCIGSALFSLSLLILTIVGRTWEDLGQILFIGVIVSLLTLISALGVYANVDAVAQGTRQPITQPSTNATPPLGWEITTTSGPDEIALAKHLTAIGAKEYGAFWCPHCFDQKQLFGKEAFNQINYVECDPQGKNPQTQVCQDANIKGFPTWEIKGELYSGTQTLEKLAELSGYSGSMDFKYSLR